MNFISLDRILCTALLCDGQFDRDLPRRRLLAEYRAGLAQRTVLRDARGGCIVLPLPWDSTYFGVPAARVEAVAGEALPSLRGLQRRSGFLFARVAGVDVQALRLLTAAGFYLVNSKLMLRKELSGAARARLPRLRRATGGVPPRVSTLAADSFRTGRFFKDPRISVEQARGMYRDWLRNHLRDGKGLLYSGNARNVGGFVAWSLTGCDGLRAGFIDLVATAPARRGRGLGRILLAAAENESVCAGADVMYANTTLDNYAAQALFVRSGYMPYNSIVELHWWRDA